MEGDFRRDSRRKIWWRWAGVWRGGVGVGKGRVEVGKGREGWRRVEKRKNGRVERMWWRGYGGREGWG
ncbi:uncharacterized protein G2W53_010448 [Senna tora]|uniref:Uncharacterized protein n=1 Tax=Senna tora TaxID=362788 RepID=A0A835C9Q6_9FABA|nr:uncharacterized protein G2W53_010448 [Senna tora]